MIIMFSRGLFLFIFQALTVKEGNTEKNENDSKSIIQVTRN